MRNLKKKNPQRNCGRADFGVLFMKKISLNTRTLGGLVLLRDYLPSFSLMTLSWGNQPDITESLTGTGQQDKSVSVWFHLILILRTWNWRQQNFAERFVLLWSNSGAYKSSGAVQNCRRTTVFDFLTINYVQYCIMLIGEVKMSSLLPNINTLISGMPFLRKQYWNVCDEKSNWMPRPHWITWGSGPNTVCCNSLRWNWLEMGKSWHKGLGDRPTQEVTYFLPMPSSYVWWNTQNKRR